MRRNILLYITASILLALNFLFYKKASKEQELYSSLVERAHTVNNCYKDLHRNINNAAVMHPGLLLAIDPSRPERAFVTDKTHTLQPLESLIAAVRDSVNIRIAGRLDTLVRREIDWIIESNVPDSIKNNRAPEHIVVFYKIDSLLSAGIERTQFLLEYRKDKKLKADAKVTTWMSMFVVISALLLFITLFLFSRQNKKKKEELGIVSGKLKETELGYRAVVEQAADAIIITDAAFRFIDINPAGSLLLGYSREEFLLLKPQDLLFEEDLADHPLRMTEIKNTKVLRFERRMKRKDGTAAETEISATVLEDGRCIVFARDIAERKKTERHLRDTIKSLDDYRFALNESTIIAFTDKRGIITSVNDNFCRISKYKAEELIGNSHKLVNSGTHSKEFFKSLWQTISSGQVWKGEIMNKAKDGTYYWVFTTIVPFLDQHNKPFQYLAIRYDITEKKEAEKAALDRLSERNTILESIADAFFAVDNNWVVTYWNRVAEKVLARPKSEILGKCLWDVYADSKDSLSYKNYHLAMARQEVVHFEDYFEPRHAWYEISAYPSGTGLSVYFKDVTERKVSEIRLNELNTDLRRQAQKLSVSNQELEQFAYVASHDLQEPLRMVTGFLSQLDKKYSDIIDDRGKQYIHFAVDGARRMRQIILDLLEFSRVGRTEDKLELVDINELVEGMQIMFRRTIEETGGRITTTALPVIKTYRTPLYQVFQNLISNALKYSRKEVAPLIEISAKELPDHWEFAIKDNGIGIAEEYFDRIFIIFQRLHNKDEFSGTGMGLAISNKIIENLGGRIWLESEEGAGSTFYFTVSKNLEA